MRDAFQFRALPAERFAPLSDLTPAALAAIGARRVVDSPYRATGPIFVRPGVPTAVPAVGEVPAMLRHRLLSVRAYDAAGMMRDAAVVQGREVEAAIEGLFARDEVRYLHVHNAGAGCYNCAVVRA